MILVLKKQEKPQQNTLYQTRTWYLKRFYEWIQQLYFFFFLTYIQFWSENKKYHEAKLNWKKMERYQLTAVMKKVEKQRGVNFRFIAA